MHYSGDNNIYLITKLEKVGFKDKNCINCLIFAEKLDCSKDVIENLILVEN